MNTTFDPQTLADDLDEVGRIYAHFFAALDDASWDRPVKGSCEPTVDMRSTLSAG